MNRPIRAFVFDVYGTLFDVHSVQTVCDELFPGKGESISQLWRTKQLNYFFERHIMGRYENFDRVTRDALRYALASHDVQATVDEMDRLLATYARLTPYEEVESVLTELQDHHTVILSNGTDRMLRDLMQYAGFTNRFNDIVSIDGIKQVKPSPAAYMHWFKTTDYERDEVLFLSSNGWDIAGAKNFGFRTAWINRQHAPVEAFEMKPDAIYSDLRGILEWKTS